MRPAPPRAPRPRRSRTTAPTPAPPRSSRPTALLGWMPSVASRSTPPPPPGTRPPPSTRALYSATPVPVMKVHAATRTTPTPTAAATAAPWLAPAPEAELTLDTVPAAATPRLHFGPRRQQHIRFPLPPPPTRPYVIPASLPSSTWNALRQRWISPDSGAAEWKASHVPVATGNWQVARARRRRSSLFRETQEIPGNKGLGWGLSCDDETLSSETFITNSPSASSGPCTSTRQGWKKILIVLVSHGDRKRCSLR
ncbi:uncharacterized protein [Miscanthus floridulus]|uniref:uncharacterized protein isoform X2 n=1 Tax=Miscanthus floridulus TaxID=154761 RepID=UPI0034590ABC